jgi:hypothetical protein
MRNTSKITAVDQPNNSTPFIAGHWPKQTPALDWRHVAVAERRIVYKGEINQISVFKRDTKSCVDQGPDEYFDKVRDVTVEIMTEISRSV